ncbi:QVPTGV class sortase B protein-sorting domain-containing protein [Arcanobacterium hippocoleae]
MKRIKLMAYAIVASLTLSMGAGAAFADGEVTNSGNLSIKKTMTVEKGTSVPAATFGFTITAAEVADGTTISGLPVKAGKQLSNNVNNAQFTGEEKLKNEVATATTSASYNFNEKQNVDYADQKNTIQRYVVKEMATQVPGVTVDDKQFLLDVYVGNDGNVKYLVGYDTTDGKTVGNKAPIVFNNKYKSHSLTISKIVEDTTAFVDENAEFEFNVTVNTLANSGVTKLTAKTIKDNQPVANSSNPAEVTVGKETTFKLKNGENFVLSGLPQGMTYSVSETPNANYTAKVQVNTEAEQASSEVQNQAMADKDSAVKFTNTRNPITPTGVLLNVAPYLVALAVVAIGGAWFVSRRMKQRQA